MSRTTRTTAQVAVAGMAIAGLVSAGTGAFASSGVAAASGTPTLKATIADHQLTLKGDTTFAAGRVDLSLTADKDSEINVIRMAKGYSFKDFRADINAFGQNVYGPGGDKEAGLRHLNHAINHITSYGGLEADGDTATGTVLLPEAGTYYLYNDSGNLPKQKQKLTVTAPEGAQTLPQTDAKVVATTKKTFRTDDVLPNKGSLTFKNVSTESPHLHVMFHVKEGTTRKQVVDSFSGAGGPPSFMLPGSAGTDTLTTGQAQTLDYSLPKGEYALVCFFPDPKTGMVHAMMGMVKIVHLK
jgi:hypothetical protein